MSSAGLTYSIRTTTYNNWFILKIHEKLSNLSAASIVFSTSIAIVIGPTPPGTGVIASTLCFNESKSASPTRMGLPLLSLILLIPTSITIAPSFMCSDLRKFGDPIAKITISATFVKLYISLLPEWHIVVVASLYFFFKPVSYTHLTLPTKA